MAESDYDHLIVGSTALAWLLAAQLALVHGRRVCLLSEPFSPFRLERSFNLSVDVVTRPDTLSLLAATSEETLKFLAGLGKGIADRADPLFVAETPESMAALAHFRHLAQALGFEIEQIADSSIATGVLCRVRGACSIADARLAAALEEPFARHGVRVLVRDETTLALKKDGTAQLTVNGDELQAAQTIFADDAAIVAELEAPAWAHLLAPESRLALLTEPARQGVTPFSVFLDRGIALRAGPGGSLSAIATGDVATAHARLAASARKAVPLRRAGEARISGVRTLDSVPLVSAGRGHKALLVAGFGLWGAFFAPAIARRIVENSTPEEAAWFAPRVTGRGSQRLARADFQPVFA